MRERVNRLSPHLTLPVRGASEVITELRDAVEKVCERLTSG